MAINYPKSDFSHINLALRFKWSKMTIRARSGAKLHAKLRDEPTMELKRARTEAKKELVAKLKDNSLIDLELASEAKIRDVPTTELLWVCCEARAALIVKLNVNLLGFFRRQFLVHYLLH